MKKYSTVHECIRVPQTLPKLNRVRTECNIYVNTDLEVEYDTGNEFYVRNWSSTNVNMYLQQEWLFTYFHLTKLNGFKVEAADLN